MIFQDAIIREMRRGHDGPAQPTLTLSSRHEIIAAEEGELLKHT